MIWACVQIPAKVKELFKTDTTLADEIETKVREAMKAPQQK